MSKTLNYPKVDCILKEILGFSAKFPKVVNAITLLQPTHIHHGIHNRLLSSPAVLNALQA